ncbi:hypothetical protein MMC12_006510 [Toensbergia leucococca]|nr:hypothetical protein [Toensbergia leucococca]
MAPPKDEDMEEGDGGYISDESSFYGDDELRAHLEELVSASRPPSHWSTHPIYLAFLDAAKSRMENSTQDPSARSTSPPAKGAMKLESKANKSIRTAPNTLQSETSAASPMATTTTQDRPLLLPRPLYNPYANLPTARQLSEPIPSFLSRLPPLTTPRSAGPWIWIANPHSSHRPTTANLAAFTTASNTILSSHKTQQISLQTSMSSRAKATITRKVNARRRACENEILAVARANGVVTGKWMLFPMPEDVNRWWKVVAEGTASGELGIAAKVATDDGRGERESRVICVYTADFEDRADVKRVLQRLVAAGLVRKKGPMGEDRGVFYKCDAFTHLGITGGNEWELKPSLYASRDVLGEGESWSLANG